MPTTLAQVKVYVGGSCGQRDPGHLDRLRSGTGRPGCREYGRSCSSKAPRSRVDSKLRTAALTRGPCPQTRPEDLDPSREGTKCRGLAPTLGRDGLPRSVPLLRLGAPRSELTSELCPRNRQAGGAERTCPGWRRGMTSAEHCPLWVCFRAKVTVGSSGLAPWLRARGLEKGS